MGNRTATTPVGADAVGTGTAGTRAAPGAQAGTETMVCPRLTSPGRFQPTPDARHSARRPAVTSMAAVMDNLLDALDAGFTPVNDQVIHEG